MAVCCIIAAAGASRRLGHPKQLVRLDGETLIERSVRVAHQAGVKRVLVILGALAQRIRPVLQPPSPSFIILENTQWQQGLSSSIRLGMDHLRACPDCDGALLMTCDQPHITAAHLHALLSTFDAHQRQCLVASGYGAIVGIPAVFPRALFPALSVLTGDEGARSLLRSTTGPAPVVVPCEAASLDIDTPDDEAQLAQWSRSGNEF